MKSIAVALLNWNGKSLLECFLGEVVNNSPEAVVYFIDNASTDNSVLFVQENFPSIRVIVLDQNYGYAGGLQQRLGCSK